jgi:hypothetical protein
MKVAILYICTGKYDIFWKGFYQSCEKYFLKNVAKEYFVFTDAEKLFDEENSKSIHKIYQQRLGWPHDTLKRFHLFSTIENKLGEFDYIFFFNANAEILRSISTNEFLPTKEEKLVAVLHPGYYNLKPSKFTYESKQKNSTAYITKNGGKYYFAGGINGGIAKDYLELIKTLKTNIDLDLQKNIIAVWHDESHLNHYLLNREIKILSPSYVYPEEWNLPFDPVVLIRDKAKLGGHDFMRGVKTKKPIKKKIAAFIRKFSQKN